METLSGLAAVYLAQGEMVKALELSGFAMELLMGNVSPKEPARIYWIRSQVLLKSGNVAGAKEVLNAAWGLIKEGANQLKREDLRRSMLQNIPLHQRIQNSLNDS
jgi:hypothetical protein